MFQVVTYDNILGYDFVNQLKSEGSKREVCVGAAHHYLNHPNSGSSFQDIVNKIVTKSDARLLFVNLMPMDTMKFLKALNSSNQAANFMVFSVQALSVVHSFAPFSRTIRSAVFSVETMVEPSTGYSNYLRGMRAGSTNSNSWFDHWYEQLYSCSLDRMNMRQYTELCSNVDSTPISNLPSFKPNYWSTSVINSVRLTAQALHKTLQFFCGHDYDGICSDFWSDDMDETLMENLKDITFTDDQGNQIRIVKGQGNILIYIGYTYFGYFLNVIMQQRYCKVLQKC